MGTLISSERVALHITYVLNSMHYTLFSRSILLKAINGFMGSLMSSERVALHYTNVLNSLFCTPVDQSFSILTGETSFEKNKRFNRIAFTNEIYHVVMHSL